MALFAGASWLVGSGCSVQAAGPERLRDKTLVVWVTPANLEQRGGSALTLDDVRSHFDGIVLGELAPRRWMAGSDFHRRSHSDQQAWPEESVSGGGNERVQIAVTYRDREVTLYRNGQKYAWYTAANAPQEFDARSVVVMGRRHLEQGDDAQFVGSIDDARIYDQALSGEAIQGLRPNESSTPAPVAWWDFENGRSVDRLGMFPAVSVVGDARIAGGRLHLGKGANFLALRQAPELGGGGDDAAISRSVRERLLTDPYRPGYHLVTPEGQCMPFDPNGAIHWKGRYHLFYIFQDKRGHNWGHVSSTDLFRWRHHPTGLISGMFSGNCFLDKEGRPTMCYHQVGQGNAMAVAVDDDLNEWKKLESNPITPKTREGDPHHDRYRSWDPFGWLEGDTYYAIFGGNRPGVAKAPRLEGEWRYVGDLMANAVAGVGLDEDVSCADFFRLGDRYMLLCISHRLGCRYYLGDWKNEQFHPTFHERMSWVDNSFFAPESLVDDRGRRIFWAWIFDAPEFKMRTESGWSGTMSLPRVLTLGADGHLRMEPPEEIRTLRRGSRESRDLEVPAGGEVGFDAPGGNSLEIELEMTAESARQFGVVVAASPGGEEGTRVYYDSDRQAIEVDTTRSSLGEGPKSVESGPLRLGPGEPLRLRVFVDKSVVEVFANGRQAVMRRIYPSRRDSVGVRFFAVGGKARVSRSTVWELEPTNPY